MELVEKCFVTKKIGIGYVTVVTTTPRVPHILRI